MKRFLNAVGQRFKKPKAQLLNTAMAAPELTGVRSVWHDTYAAGLTPERLSRILRAAMQGEITEYLVLAGEIERLEHHCRSVLSTRKLAVKGLEILVDAATDDQADVKLADEVRALIDRPGTRRMVGHLLDGLAKGFSVVELVWDISRVPWVPSYEWRDPTFFQFDRITGSEIRLRDGTPDGVELPPNKFLVHQPDLVSGLPVAGGLAMLGVWSFLFKSFSLQDWSAFAEVYGMPIRIGKYGPSHTEDDKDVLRLALGQLGRMAAAMLPQGMEVDFVKAAEGAKGPEVFERLANYWDKQTSKALLGQTMTADDGASLSQAKVHNEVRLDILQADAGDIEETLQRDLVEPYVNLNWGPPGSGLYPQIRVVVPEPEDTKLLVQALSILVPMGLQVEESVVRDKLGIPDPAAGARLLTAPSPAPDAPAETTIETNRAINRQGDTDMIDELMDEFMGDWKEMTGPLVDPVAAALEQASSYEEALALLEGLVKEMDPRVAAGLIAQATFGAAAIGDATDDG